MDLRKFERIAEQLEKSLGIETDNGLLDNAEGAADAGADLLPDAIDENIEKEKQNADIQPSPLEADDDEVQALTTEIQDTEDAIDDIEQTEQLNDDIADLEQQLDKAEEAPEAPAVEDGADTDGDDLEDDDDDAEVEGDSDDDGIELEKDEAKACIASMKRLLRIAKAVKMSKDMPACKKEEVLSKIQKASDKLRKGAFGGAPATVEDDEVSTEDHPSVSSFVQIFNTKRGKLNGIMKGRGKGNVRIRSLLGTGVDNKIIGNMTVSELFRTFSSVLSALK